MNEHAHDELLEQLAEEYEPELLTLETQDGGEIIWWAPSTPRRSRKAPPCTSLK